MGLNEHALYNLSKPGSQLYCFLRQYVGGFRGKNHTVLAVTDNNKAVQSQLYDSATERKILMFTVEY